MSPVLTLQKIVGFLVMPAGLIWLALLGLTFASWRRRARLPAFLTTIVLGAYTLAGNVHVGHSLMRRLERQVPDSHLLPTVTLDAVCVFGGATELDPFGRPELACSGDRVIAAARLYHAGLAKVLVASGVASDSLTGPRNLAEETRQIWRSLGVPDSAIELVPEPCWVTSDEARAFKQLKAKHSWERVGLLSSAWHLPRIMRLAQKEGLAGIPVGSDWRGREHVFQWQDCVPQGAGFWRVNLAFWEFVGGLSGR
jgi:uncharacterized SAM-binding protein YcdF (DUF218 family)